MILFMCRLFFEIDAVQSHPNTTVPLTIGANRLRLSSPFHMSNVRLYERQQQRFARRTKAQLFRMYCSTSVVNTFYLERAQIVLFPYSL